jgi:hypothetical protein
VKNVSIETIIDREVCELSLQSNLFQRSPHFVDLAVALVVNFGAQVKSFSGYKTSSAHGYPRRYGAFLKEP